MVSNWLGEDEERAWRNFRRMFSLLEARLAGELTEQTGLSMSDYTVLINLVAADEHQSRVSGLAQHMTWSQSRLSHQIKRMESRGLVTKEEVESDGRGAFVKLTRKGLKALAAATPTHMTGIREHMIDLLTTEQIKALDAIAATVVNHLSESADSDG
jgi:DNA-binding MarR family transcriptional regulator